MTNKKMKPSLRGFLTTASALAVIAVGAQEANAIDIGNAVYLTNAGPDAAGTVYRFNHANSALNVNDARTTGFVISAGINPAVPAVINADVTITGISNDNTAAAAGSAIGIRFGGAHTVTLNAAGIAVDAAGLPITAVVANHATTYDQLGNIDFLNTASTVAVTGNNGVFAGSFISTGSNHTDGHGTLSVSGSSNTFSGANIGTANNEISLVVSNNTAGTNTTFNSAAQMILTSVTVSGAGNFISSGAHGIAVRGGDFDASASSGDIDITGPLQIINGNDLQTGTGNFRVRGAAAVNGDIILNNIAGKTVAFNNAVTTTGSGNFDATNAAGPVNLNTGGAVNTLIDGTFKTGAGLVTVGTGGAASVLTVTGNGVAANADTFVVGTGGLVMAGNAGSDLIVTSGNAVFNNTTGGVTVIRDLTVTAGNIVFNNTGGASAVTVGRDLLVTAGNFTTTGTGDITVTGTTTLTAGNMVLGASKHVFTALTTLTKGNFTGGAGAVTFTGGLTVTAGSFTSAAGAITVGGAALNVSDTITTGAGRLVAGGLVTAGNSSSAASGVVIGAGGAEFNLGVTVTKGNLDLSADTKGSIVAGGALTMSAQGTRVIIGAGGLAVNNQDITFTNGGQVVTADGKDLTLTGAGNVVAGAGYSADIVGGGTLKLGTAAAGYTGIIKGQIGTADLKLKEIIVTPTAGGAQVSVIGGAGSTTTKVYTNKTTIFENATLKVDAAVNTIDYFGTIDANGNNKGTLNLVGANKITIAGAVGGTANLNAITIGDGATVVFQDIVKTKTMGTSAGGGGSKVTLTKDFTGTSVNVSAANDTLSVLGNVRGAILAGGAGTVNFGSGAQTNITVDGDNGNANGIGGAGALGAVNLNLGGGTLTLTSGKVNINALTFLSDDTFVIGNAVAGGVTIGAITTKNANSGTLVINSTAAPFATAGDIGTVGGASLKAIKFGVGTTFNINDNVYAPISGQVAISVRVDGKTLTSVGTADAPVTSFATNGGGIGVTLDNLYATSVTNAGTIRLNNNGTFIANAFTAPGGNYVVTDNATIGNIGSGGNAVATLTINKVNDGTVLVKGNTIAATAFTQNGNTLKLTNDTTISGTTYTIAGASTIDTSNKALTLATGLVVNAPLTLKVALPAAGQSILVVNSKTAPVIAAGNVLSIAIDTSTGLPAANTAYNVFGNAGGVVVVAQKAAGAGAAAIDTTQVQLTSSGRFATAQYVDAALNAQLTKAAPAGAAVHAVGTLIFNVNADTTKVLGDAAGSASPELKKNAAAFVQAINSGTLTADAAKMAGALNNMTGPEAGEFMNRTFTHPEVLASAQVASVTASSVVTPVMSAMGSRVSTVSRVANGDSGVAAGDSGERFGLWGQVLGTAATQKERSSASGFETRGGGLVVGFDTMVNDNATFGMLASTVRNNIKFKNANTGDKSQATSFILGAYGNYDIGATDFFVQGNLAISQTAINSTGKKLVATGGKYQFEKAKYDILGVGAEVVGGYKYSFDTTYIAPTVGLRYNYFGDTSYTGTGLTVGNQSIKTKSTNTVSGLLGTRIGATVDMDGTNIMPEAHINLSYAFNAPSSKTTFKINGAPSDFTYRGPKAPRFGVNGGFSIMAEAEGLEYGAGYDATIGDKYLGHQGTLKVRVKL